jgi:hypothetical protein
MIRNTLGKNLIVILLFTFMYFTLSKTGDQHFKGLDKHSSLFDHVYFASTIQSTIGFGDIHPKTPMAKLFVMIQQFVVLLGAIELFSATKKMI